MSKSFRLLAPTAMVVSCLIGIAFYCHLSSLFPKSSDQVNYLYAGLDVLHGNFILRGWTLTPPDFYTSDILLSAALSGVLEIVGRHNFIGVILSLQPAIVWTGVVATAVYFVWSSVTGFAQRCWAVAAVLSILGIPLIREEIGYLFLYSAIHVGSVIYCLWILWAASKAIERNRHANIAVFSLAAAGTFGDPLVIFVAILPVIAYSAFQQKAWTVGALAAIGATFGKFLLHVVAMIGGFETSPLPMAFASYANLSLNVSTALHALLQLFSADVFGKNIYQCLPEISHFPIFLAAGATLAMAVANLGQSREKRPSPFVSLLAIGTCVDIATVIFSNRAELEANGLGVARYLFPAWAYLALILSLYGPQKLQVRTATLLGLCASLFVTIPLLGQNGVGIIPQTDQAVVLWLEQNAPHQGIGSYFSAAMFQLASNGKLHVEPGIAGTSGIIVPLTQISPKITFDTIINGDFFVVFPPSLRTYTAEQIEKTFGSPSARKRIGLFEIFIYRKLS